MNITDIARLRFNNQQIANSNIKSAGEIAYWMGALQAQDFNMSKWALGIRLQNSNLPAIHKAYDTGEIVRSHLLRPTWHIVSSKDIYWMLELTAPQIKSATLLRDNQLGLTKDIIAKSNSVIERSLRDGIHLTRQEIISNLTDAKIKVDKNRASHLLLRAETDGIICSGKMKGDKQTYTLLSEWVPKERTLTRDEALRELAMRYFTSHGPATLMDFKWWSGLSSKESKLALEFVKSETCSVSIENNTFWFTNDCSDPGPRTNEIYLLPAFDELVISYRDRTACLPMINQKKAVSNNGIFYPVLVMNGQVIGTWKHKTKNDIVYIAPESFIDNVFEHDIYSSKSYAQYTYFLEKKPFDIIT